jgi:UDP-N-acetylmuramoylalanine--D-glutamate ligase
MSLAGFMASSSEGVDQGWAGARVTVVGLAREGLAVARFLAGRGARVTVTDSKDAAALADAVASLAGLPIQFALGEHPDWVLDADTIFVSPGIPRTIPLLIQAVSRGVRCSSETELFFNECPAEIVGITGSSGKTTTTTLVGLILQQAGFQTRVGGNIGHPLLGEVDQIQSGDKVVMELSSFQLEHLRVSPHIGAILNVTPNHLDRHGTMECYTRAKWQVVSHQKPGDVAVFGVDDAAARGLERDYRLSHPDGIVALFSAEAEVARGAFLRDERIVLTRDGQLDVVCETGEIRLRGRHNVYNVLAACAIAGEAGARAEAMSEIVTSFAGIEHRLETVREVGGVRYVNDSIATSPERSIAALRSYEEPIVLLAGGRDKSLTWDTWADIAVQRARRVMVFGEAASLIEGALVAAMERNAYHGRPACMTAADVVRAGTLDAAVVLASQVALPGDVVLLSPGGTSYDAFVDFAHRGQRFRELVRSL